MRNNLGNMLQPFVWLSLHPHMNKVDGKAWMRMVQSILACRILTRVVDIDIGTGFAQYLCCNTRNKVVTLGWTILWLMCQMRFGQKVLLHPPLG